VTLFPPTTDLESDVPDRQRCFCCGLLAERLVIDGTRRVPMHFDCWETHHASPTVGHTCARLGAARGQDSPQQRDPRYDARRSESVVSHGVTLYAPVVACRPVRPEDLDPARRETWDRVMATNDVEATVVPGSTSVACEGCSIEIAVGPRQQDMVDLARSVGLRPHQVCLLCAGLQARHPEADVRLLATRSGAADRA
jgi:hypothetical protein